MSDKKVQTMSQEIKAMDEQMKVIEKESIDKIKKQLASVIAETFKNWKRDSNITQSDFAVRIGSSQPRVSNIIKGNIDSFTVDKLLSFCVRLQLSTHIQSKPLKNMKTETRQFMEELNKKNAA